MSDSFDPYRVWLGVPPESRPPTHYEMLGISPNEQERAVIEAAVLRQSGYVRNFQIGKYGKDAARILNEIAAAKICLLDPTKRAKYDAELHARNASESVPTSQALPAPLAPMIDLDQLAGPAAPLSRPLAADAARRRPPRLGALSRKRKPSTFARHFQIAAAATALVIALAVIAFWPRRSQQSPEIVNDSVGQSDTLPFEAAPAVSVEPVDHSPENAPPAALPAPATLAADIVFADFEGGDYNGWQATGNAFGQTPVGGALQYQAPVTGFMGKGLVNTFIDGDKATGKLTSAEFTIARKYITFLIGGGCRERRACINLMVDGDVARSTTGRAESQGDTAEGLEKLQLAFWDVADLAEKTARIEIVDDSTELWGHINVDQIVFTNRTPIEHEFGGKQSQAIVPRDRAKDWNYGYARSEGDAILEFMQLPYFNGHAWRGSVEWPDPQIDWALLDAVGGHPGSRHAVVRRWVSPAEGVVTINGTLTHMSNEAGSDGVRGRVVAGRTVKKGEWPIHASSTTTNVAMFNVALAESVDFVVDCMAHSAYDGFEWPVTLKLEGQDGTVIDTWDSVADFAGPERAARAVSQFAEFQGHWVLRYPAPYEHSLAIDADGNVEFSGYPNISRRGLLRKDGDAVTLARNEEPLARLRIENEMLLAEKLRVIPDWPGDARSGVGTRAEGTGARQDGERPPTSQLRDGDSTWADFDLHGNTVSDGFARLTRTALSTKETYAGPLDISVVARTDNAIRVFASAHAGLLFNYWEKDHNQLRGWTPNGGYFEHAVTALKPNTWYRLRWRITVKSFQVFVDDQLILEERGEYDLSASNPVFVQGGVNDSTIDVKSFTVTPLTKADERAAGALKNLLDTKVKLIAPYPAPEGGKSGRISVQYAVMEVVQQAGLRYDFNTSLRNTDPACRLWVRPRINNQTCGQALKAILDPVGLNYKIADGVVVLEKK